MTDHQPETEASHSTDKTHHACKCRECSPVTRMLERMDAWKAAQGMLESLKYDDDVKGPSPMEVGTLASWLYEGSEEGN